VEVLRIHAVIILDHADHALVINFVVVIYASAPGGRAHMVHARSGCQPPMVEVLGVALMSS